MKPASPDARRQRPVSRPFMMARVVKGLQQFTNLPPGEWRVLLERAGLAPHQVAGDDGTIPLHSGFAAFEAAAALVGDETLGIRYARAMAVGDTGPLGFAAVSARTVGEAMQTIGRFIPLVSSMRQCRFERDDLAGSIVWQYSGGGAHHHYQFISWGVAAVMMRIAPALDPGWLPLAVVLDVAPPGSLAPHREFFGPGLRFERGPNRFSVQAELLDRPMPAANPRLFNLMTRLAEMDQRQSGVRGSEFEAEVRAHIAQLLHDGRGNARDLALSLGLTPHGLRSKLKSHALDARSLIDDVRRETALVYLLETDLNMTEIAFALGYADSSIFTRSCHKWFGRPPSDIRSQGMLS